ncbi:hypothetical protein I4U23_022497 [Adineta vaga]|nr:hypothetical protein I4U23_022497 [Adineta vaga]
MATAISSINEAELHDNNEHLELFTLIWLDVNTTSKDNQDTEQKLRRIINHLKKFRDAQKCQQYIEQRATDRFVLIVSGRLGQQLVPSIDKLQQVSSVYVYCMDRKIHEQWASNFSKVKAVISNFNQLISKVKEDHKIQMIVEEPLMINLFNTSDSDKSTTRVNDQFISSQMLIDCLLRMKPNMIDKVELITRCKTEYEGNHVELHNLREFEQEYSSDKALWWYTRKSFFCKILNTALHRQDIHMMFLLRSYIFDIHRQLQCYQSKCPLRVFRSQIIPSDQLNTLKEWNGKFISINSFFSTVTNSSKALSCLDNFNVSTTYERVLFEIDADASMSTTQSFADISAYTYLAGGLEVIFMLDSIFRVNNVSRDENQIWTISMTLYRDDELKLKQVLIDIKNQNGSGETNLQTLGKILWKTGKFDQAETYYRRAFNEILPTDPLLITVCENLAEICSQKGDYDAHMYWHQKSLEINKQNPSNSSMNKNQTTTMFHISANRFLETIITNEDSKEHVHAIMDYTKEPLLSLTEACVPLIDIIYNLSSYIQMALNKTPQVPLDGLTVDESAAIRLYTIEWESPHQSLYSMLNSALKTGNRQNLQPYFKYVKLFLTALIKLPCIPPQTVWRGITKNMSNQFPQDAAVTWWTFSSCTSSLPAIENCMHSSNAGERTLISIEIINGREIRGHSHSDFENEIILLPGTSMVVQSRLKSTADLCIIHLKQVIPNEMLLEPPFKNASIFPKTKKPTWYRKLKLVMQ